jgi:hypothetical protein
MTLAAVDRLVHHATILEMNVESYLRKIALNRKRGPGRLPVHATPNELDKAMMLAMPPDCRAASIEACQNRGRRQLSSHSAALSHPDCRAIYLL